jgi:hypothetical protein
MYRESVQEDFTITGPKRFELLFIDPASLTKLVPLRMQHSIKTTKSDSPWVDSGTWDVNAGSLMDDEKYIILRKHFQNGETWDECGIYPYLAKGLRQRQRIAASRGARGSFDGLKSEAEFKDRYKRIDVLFSQVASDGRLKTPWEVDPTPTAQRKGIHVLLGRGGEFLFGGSGFHRLIIAQTLKLKTIPVSLSIAHINAVQEGHLDRVRIQRDAILKEHNIQLPEEGICML